MNSNVSSTEVVVIAPCFYESSLPKLRRAIRTDVDKISTVLNYSRLNAFRIEQALGIPVWDGTAEVTDMSRKLGPQYASFISSIPGKLGRDGMPLMARAHSSVNSSIWALSTIAEKNTKNYPAYLYLCVTKCILENEALKGVEKVWIACSSRASETTLASALKDKGLKVISVNNGRPSIVIDWAKVIFRRFRLAMRFIFIRLAISRYGRNSSLENTGRILFYSQYARSWRQSPTGFRDRFLVGLPSKLEQHLGSSVGYVVNIGGTYFIRSINDIRRDLADLASGKSGIAKSHYFVLEGYIGIIEALAILLSPRYVWVFSKLLSRRHKSAFAINGINLQDAIRREIFSSMLTVSCNLFYMRSLQRLLATENVKVLVHPFFEYAWGKAILCAAGSIPDCRAVAVQHGPCASNLLLFTNDPSDFKDEGTGITLPQADRYYLDGEVARRRLEESGYSDSRLHIFGAPRLDDLRLKHSSDEPDDVDRLVRKSRMRGHIIVLLTPTPSDHESFLEFITEGFDRSLHQDAYTFLWKHPPNLDRRVQSILEFRNQFFSWDNVHVVEGTIPSLIAVSDVLIATSSTTALEALAMNCRTICLGLPGLLNFSPLIDVDGVATFVHHPAVLAGILNQYGTTNQDLVDSFMRDQFDDLDGMATDRVANDLLAWIGDNTSIEVDLK